MADVEDIDLPSATIDAVNDTIQMWLLTIQEVPERIFFRRDRTAIRSVRERHHRLFKTLIPAPGGD